MSGSVVPNGWTYQVVLVLHLIAVIVGFGGLILARTRIRRVNPDEAASTLAADALGATERWVEWFVYAVPVLGVVLVMLSEDHWHFSQAWIGLSLVTYLAALGLHQGILRPNAHRMLALANADEGTELVSRARKAKIFGVAFDALLVTAVALMVMKPGA
ncbi:MAG: DUF2269 family protein [Pseudonocardiaceae bacterium]